MTPRRARPRLWPLLTVLKASLIAVALAALLAAAINHWLWGYWFVRPGLDSRVSGATRLVSITPVTPEAQSSPERQSSVLELVPAAQMQLPSWPSATYPGPGWFRREISLDESDYPFYDLRALRSLEKTGIATQPVPALPASRLTGLLAAVQNSGIVAPESAGYQQWKPDVWPYSGGMVYELTGPRAEPLILVALRGGEVSNDHHPYYEVLLEPQPGAAPRVLSAKRFFFDVAGIEGAEFPRLFRLLAILFLAAAIPASLWAIASDALTRYLRRKRGHCEHCNYDLAGNTTGICPECGRTAERRRTSEPRA